MKSQQAIRADARATKPRSSQLVLLDRRINNRSVFPTLLLYLLAQQPDHGYGVMERLEHIGGEFLSVNTNRIYPVLQRLEEQGLVTGVWDHPTKRVRRTYSVTPRGHKALRRVLHVLRPRLDALLEALQAMRVLVYADSAAS